VPTQQNPKHTRTAAWLDVPVSFASAPPARISATIDTTEELTGISRTTIYDMLARGQLLAVKNRRRTLVVWQSVIDYFDSLPNAKFQDTNAPASSDRMGSREGSATSPVVPRRHRGQRP
jgi:hypothetical protein